MKINKIGKYGSITQYHAIDNGRVITFEIERKKDNIGTLLVLETTAFGRHECYGMDKVKQKLSEYFGKEDNNSWVI